MSTPRATEIINSQPALQPGQDGYWRVWGASVRDVQAGDIVLLKYADGEACEYEVDAYAPRGNDHDTVTQAFRGVGNLNDQIRPRFRATDGELFTIGALQPMALIRKSTHNILSDYV